MKKIIIDGKEYWQQEECDIPKIPMPIRSDILINNQPERSKREDLYGMKATIDENGILTMENGEKYDLNQPIEDAVL